MEEIIEIFNLVDLDCNHRISISEFIAASIEKESFLNEDKVNRTFKMFDVDGSGTIDIPELKAMFSYCQIDDNVWREMLEQVSSTGSTVISYKDFADVM